MLRGWNALVMSCTVELQLWALSARLLYLSMDRPEVAFAAKELCRHFAHPTQTGVEALKRAVRFLLGLPRLVWAFPFQEHTHNLRVYVDTDFGGCQIYASIDVWWHRDARLSPD